MTPPLRVALVADCRFPLAEPFAGGLQSMTWHLAKGLRERGWGVTVFAAAGSDPEVADQRLETPRWEPSATARLDVSMPSTEWMQEHHAYLDLMLSLARGSSVDVVHNNSLHHLPVAMAELLRVPVVTTLHTPPTPWLESAISLARGRLHPVAVSGHTARAWAHVVDPLPAVVPNGVDPERWPAGPGGEDLVWMGRLAPEKGAALAIDIARATGRRLRLAGPVSDPAYWQREIAPRLGSGIEYVGHLSQRELAALVGSSAVCLVTPEWDEPYGLVAAEALACGTPVLGFARGGLPEVVSPECARLVAPRDVDAAVRLLPEVERLSRAAARRRAVEHCSVDAMVDAYARLYQRVAEQVPARLRRWRSSTDPAPLTVPGPRRSSRSAWDPSSASPHPMPCPTS